MCREQLPVWQQFWQEHGSENVRLVTVAVDAAGPQRPAEFVRRAGLTLPALIDRRATLAQIFGFNVVPNGVWIDSSGGLRYQKYGGFDIRKEETITVVKDLLTEAAARPADGRGHAARKAAGEPSHLERGDRLAQAGDWAGAADAYQEAVNVAASDSAAAFSLGVALLELGRRDEAVAAWQRALAIDPAKYVVRKQIWAVQDPSRFYPKIDLEWQRQQLAREGVLKS